MDEYANLHVVAVYAEDRAYGGPEEGGWWYTTGELVGVVGAVFDEDEAWEIARMWNETNPLEDRYGRRGYPGERATVVELGRRQLKPEYMDYACHGYGDELWEVDKDHNSVVKAQYAETRWDIPTYYPEGRPHYC
jgi:hypothetical protein